MKILIAAGIFPPDVGGPATYSKILGGELAARGHTVRVVTYTDSENRKIGKSDYPIHLIVRSPFKPWRYFKFFRALIKHGRDADLIYAQGPVSDGYPAYMAARYLKKPLAVKITGDYSWERAASEGLTDVLIDEFQTLKDYPPAIRRMRDVQHTVCHHARIIITPSEYLKKLVTGWGIKPEKIKVVYNAVERPEVRSQKSEVRRKLGIAENTFLILSSGRDVPWKGFALLAEAAAELQTLHPEMEIKILHRAGRAELHEHIRAADVYVLNTGYEGLSNTLVEVLHLGTPIITTNVCGNPEVIKHEQNGLLVDYNNKAQLSEAIMRIYSDKNLRDELRNNARLSLEKFTLDNMINETERLLIELVGK